MTLKFISSGFLLKVNFSQELFTNKTFDDYEAGFGEVTKEFFIGLDRLYR